MQVTQGFPCCEVLEMLTSNISYCIFPPAMWFNAAIAVQWVGNGAGRFGHDAENRPDLKETEGM